jgi:hypothetical protein
MVCRHKVLAKANGMPEAKEKPEDQAKSIWRGLCLRFCL